MDIDLNKLNVSDIIVDDELLYTTDDYNNTSIKKLDPVKVTGKIFINSYDEINVSLNIVGNMYLEDAITLDLIKYPFDIEIEENINDNKEYFNIENNKIDLKEFVWKNIVLEIPIRVSASDEVKTMEGEGWNLNKPLEDDSKLAELNVLFDKKD